MVEETEVRLGEAYLPRERERGLRHETRLVDTEGIY